MPHIKVAIRIKPEKGEHLKGFSYQAREGDKTRIELTASGTKNEFNFDHLFDENASQEEIFSVCCVPIIQNVLDGQNGTLFAYGQTGAGKTHTVTGPETEEYDERGLCMRSADYIFRKIRSARDSAFTVKFSVIEIYNDSVLDLLRESIKDSPKLVIVDTPDGVVVPALYLLPLENEEEAYTKLVEANLNRSVAAHQLNRRSSRSHVIYSFYITRSRVIPNSSGVDTDGDVMQSKLHLVDLAGSERLEKTGSTGGVAKEANHINKSLSFLEQVVLALTKKSQGGVGGTMRGDSVVAYRQSKLTYILKDSIGGNCNTVLVGCIWPHANHLWETLSTLRFATRMRCIENRPHRNNLVTGNGANSSTRTLMLKIDALKKELAMRDMMYGYAMATGGGGAGGGFTPTAAQGATTPFFGNKVSGGNTLSVTVGGANGATNLTKNQQARSMQMVQDFVMTDGDADTVDVKSLAEIALVARTLRAAIWIACGEDEQKVAEVMRAAVSTAMNDVRVDASGLLTPTPPSVSLSHARGVIHEVSIAEEEEQQAEREQSIEQDYEYSQNRDGHHEGDYGDLEQDGVRESAEENAQFVNPVVQPQSYVQSKDISSEGLVAEEQNLSGRDGEEDSGAFDAFKQSDGYEFHQQYESVKVQLKEAKALQRTLVKVVNEHKANIDVKSDVVKQINDILSSGDEAIEGAGGKEVVAHDLKNALDDLAKQKSEYKNSRNELLKCKDNIAYLTVQKQQSLANLVKAFEEYSTL